MLRIYVGSEGDRNEELRFLNQIEKVSSERIYIKWLRPDSDLPKKWVVKDWKKSNESFKFAIPELCKFEYRALYIDVHCDIRDDLSKLLKLIPPDEYAWCPVVAYRQEVVVINSALFNWDWWMAMDWMRNSGWSEEAYLKYIAGHDQMDFGKMPEWNWHGSEADDVKIYRGWEK